MHYIVDASVIAEYLIAGSYTIHAAALFAGTFEGDLFTVPELCLNECTNVIWKAVRFRGMPPQQGFQSLMDLKALPLKRIPTKSVLSLALSIGLKHELPIYDSLYIALAQRSQLPFVTLDFKQGQAATAEGINLVPITQFNRP
jgi:predicted nucleic acid-binding protein